MMLLRFAVLFAILIFPAAGAAADLRIEVDLSESRLRTYAGDELLQEYGVGVGSDKHPTPEGRFVIKKVVWNPSWVPPREKWARKETPKPPGHPRNPMKAVKVFFREPDYYIHGSDDPEGLSHGCIRMSPADATEVAQLVMEQGGQPRPLPWYRRMLRRRSSQTVRLSEPVIIQIRS